MFNHYLLIDVQGLLPVWFNRRQGTYSKSNLYTVGAMADSFFEYLLKLWLLHQKQVHSLVLLPTPIPCLCFLGTCTRHWW